MKKLLLLFMCASLSIGASAQLKKVKISSAQATSQQSGEDASKAIDGNVSTLWHSQYQGTTFPVAFTVSGDYVSCNLYRFIYNQDAC